MTQRFKGLVYVKQGRVGSKSEGPDYYLQTVRGEYRLRYQERHLWQPDYQLEFFGRRMVAVSGALADDTITVQSIEEILAPRLPGEEDREVKLVLGDTVSLDDVKVSFLQMVEDSRCPTGTVCVWEGQAVVSLQAVAPGGTAEPFTLTLRAGDEALATKVVAGHRFTVIDLVPHPDPRIRIDPSKYTVTLRVAHD